MKLSSSDLDELADVAIRAAREAGQMIAQSRPREIQHKAAGRAGGASLASHVVTEIDRRSEDLIVDLLTPTVQRFGLGLLAEERDDDGGRLTADYFWCIDPLDGTLPFIEGSPGYAVSIALVSNDGTPWIGVVCDPVEATVLHAIKDVGAFRDGHDWPTRAAQSTAAQPSAAQPGAAQPGAAHVGGEVLSVFADRSFLTRDDHDEVVDALGQIAMELGLTGLQIDSSGGAVINACRVLANAPACYFKHPKPSGGGSLWDFAATACLFNETGAIATDIHGRPLDLNRPDSTFMNHRGALFATDETLAARIRAIRPIDS